MSLILKITYYNHSLIYHKSSQNEMHIIDFLKKYGLWRDSQNLDTGIETEADLFDSDDEVSVCSKIKNNKELRSNA